MRYIIALCVLLVASTASAKPSKVVIQGDGVDVTYTWTTKTLNKDDVKALFSFSAYGAFAQADQASSAAYTCPDNATRETCTDGLQKSIENMNANASLMVQLGLKLSPTDPLVVLVSFFHGQYRKHAAVYKAMLEYYTTNALPNIDGVTCQATGDEPLTCQATNRAHYPFASWKAFLKIHGLQEKVTEQNDCPVGACGD